MTRPRVSGSSNSMTIINPWAKVENNAIAVPSGMTAVAKPIAVINTEPIARPALYGVLLYSQYADRARACGTRFSQFGTMVGLLVKER
jgi:hypothetical protein